MSWLCFFGYHTLVFTIIFLSSTSSLDWEYENLDSENENCVTEQDQFGKNETIFHTPLPMFKILQNMTQSKSQNLKSNVFDRMLSNEMFSIKQHIFGKEKVPPPSYQVPLINPGMTPTLEVKKKWVTMAFVADNEDIQSKNQLPTENIPSVLINETVTELPTTDDVTNHTEEVLQSTHELVQDKIVGLRSLPALRQHVHRSDKVNPSAKKCHCAVKKTSTPCTLLCTGISSSTDEELFKTRILRFTRSSHKAHMPHRKLESDLEHSFTAHPKHKERSTTCDDFGQCSHPCSRKTIEMYTLPSIILPPTYITPYYTYYYQSPYPAYFWSAIPNNPFTPIMYNPESVNDMQPRRKKKKKSTKYPKFVSVEDTDDEGENDENKDEEQDQNEKQEDHSRQENEPTKASNKQTTDSTYDTRENTRSTTGLGTRQGSRKTTRYENQKAEVETSAVKEKSSNEANNDSSDPTSEETHVSTRSERDMNDASLNEEFAMNMESDLLVKDVINDLKLYYSDSVIRNCYCNASTISKTYLVIFIVILLGHLYLF